MTQQALRSDDVLYLLNYAAEDYPLSRGYDDAKQFLEQDLNADYARVAAETAKTGYFLGEMEEPIRIIDGALERIAESDISDTDRAEATSTLTTARAYILRNLGDVNGAQNLMDGLSNRDVQPSEYALVDEQIEAANILRYRGEFGAAAQTHIELFNTAEIGLQHQRNHHYLISDMTSGGIWLEGRKEADHMWRTVVPYKTQWPIVGCVNTGLRGSTTRFLVNLYGGQLEVAEYLITESLSTFRGMGHIKGALRAEFHLAGLPKDVSERIDRIGSFIDENSSLQTYHSFTFAQAHWMLAQLHKQQSNDSSTHLTKMDEFLGDNPLNSGTIEEVIQEQVRIIQE